MTGTASTNRFPKVSRAVGIDHPQVLDALRANCPRANIELIGGDFLEMAVEGRFTKVLIYSVIQLLADEDEVYAFLDQALSLLALGGRVLIGDLPNKDRKARFLDTPEGKVFEPAWRDRMSVSNGQGQYLIADFLPDPENLVVVNDDFVFRFLNRYRGQGLDAEVLAQPENLSFGHTREDVLILKAG